MVDHQFNTNDDDDDDGGGEGDGLEVAALLGRMVDQEVKEYGLNKPVVAADNSNQATNHPQHSAAAPNNEMMTLEYTPSHHIEIDGALVERFNTDDDDTSDSSSSTSSFDTSTILVFDHLVDETLRKDLLAVVKGTTTTSSEEEEWDDDQLGPDPTRWHRGGLDDIPTTDEDDKDDDSESSPSCWGLTNQAVMDLCQNKHTAISTLESKLTALFPNFIVSRLPEAVFGPSVSPLTANAPVHGDIFDYHNDADPYQTPPGLWTDIYGRYPNRAPGKPRFMSCLL